MKKSIIVSLLSIIFANSAFALTLAPTLSSTNGQSETQTSTSTASTNGNQQAINIAASVIPTETTQNVNYSGTETLKNVPSVSGPNLTSSGDTCMGSSSGSANGPGFGISVGSTWTDSNCRMLKNSRELFNQGMRAASMALLCNDPDIKQALEDTGFKCPIHKKSEDKQPAIITSSHER